MTPPLYHGGARRLDRAGLILPPSRTGVPSSSEYGAAGVHRRDRVYLTSELEEARLFALLAPIAAGRGRGGDVYLVEPIGELERDPDYSGPADVYAAPMARIVRVVERNVTRWQGLDADEALDVLTPDGDRYIAAERYLDLAGGKDRRHA